MKVALAFYPGDMDMAAKLSAWIAELGPNKGHTAVLGVDDRCHPNVVSQIRANFDKSFDAVEIVDVRHRVDGWPEGANMTFALVAKAIQYSSNPCPWLWLEPDVVPLRSGWVQALADEYDQDPKRPFLGDFVRVENVEAHMSGIAIYPGMLTEFAGQAVMASNIAWDVAAAYQILPQFKQTHLIAHKWKHPPLKDQSELDNLLGQLKDTCVLFHADKSGSMIELLRERQKPAVVERVREQSPVAGQVGAAQGTLGVFIKTYPKDREWLRWCLRSIEKFVHSTAWKITIVTPQVVDQDAKIIIPQAEWLERQEYCEDGYLSQQLFKLHADEFLDTDYILHIDSDTIFTRKTDPMRDYFHNGKYVWMITPIDQCHPDTEQAWRKVMRKFMNADPAFEFMRRFPFVFPRWLYKEFRDFCERQHGITIDDYIRRQPYREFSEFNCIGFFAHKYFHDRFEWFDTNEHPESEWPVLTADQQWSHNPIPTEKWEQILSAVPNAGTVSNEIPQGNEILGANEPRRSIDPLGGGQKTSRRGGRVSGGRPTATIVEKPPRPQHNKTSKEKLQANAAKARAAMAQKRALAKAMQHLPEGFEIVKK